MKLLFVVQRYGIEVAGGAERACREFATRLAARGHEVQVLTSRARSYVDWADEYPAGVTEIEDVTVHRLSVAQPRDPVQFSAVQRRVMTAPRHAAMALQLEWIRLQGPVLPELPGWLDAHVEEFDVVVAFTYLYWPSWAALPIASGRVPTVFHPLAHDEGPLGLELFNRSFELPDGLGFLTVEEQHLVEARFGCSQPAIVTGVGTELEVVDAGDRFREQYALGDRPYLVFVGRLDPGKGSDELFDFFRAYKERRPGPLALVIVGDPVQPLPPHPDVFTTGFVDEAVKGAAISGSLALVQPSYFESFSIVLIEAWAHGKPALVQGYCAVLAGQASRSGGAIPYRGYGEFETALDLLLEAPELRERLGRAGRAYVVEHYDWERILEGYEDFLRQVTRD